MLYPFELRAHSLSTERIQKTYFVHYIKRSVLASVSVGMLMIQPLIVLRRPDEYFRGDPSTRAEGYQLFDFRKLAPSTLPSPVQLGSSQLPYRPVLSESRTSSVVTLGLTGSGVLPPRTPDFRKQHTVLGDGIASEAPPPSSENMTKPVWSPGGAQSQDDGEG
jgi:hypothetical protein